MQGFMLRKNVWLDLVEDFTQLQDMIKENIRITYVRDIYLKVNREKKNFMLALRASKSTDQVISVHKLNNDKIFNNTNYSNNSLKTKSFQESINVSQTQQRLVESTIIEQDQSKTNQQQLSQESKLLQSSTENS